MFYKSLIFPDLRMTLDTGDTEGLREFCEALHPGVVAEVISDLEPDDLWRVLVSCDPELRAEIFGFLELHVQIGVVEVGDRKRLSKLIEHMAPDDRVDLLEMLDEEKVENLLPLIAQAERADIRKLLSYPDGSAGSIMTTEYASLREDITVAEALDRLRVQAPDSETIYYIYILDDGRRLDGIVSLRELIQAKRSAKLSDIMHRDAISVRVDDEAEDVARELARFDFLAIPVVDNQHQLVGIVTLDDALDVLEEQATEDAHMQGAVQPLDESYRATPLLVLAQKRGVWLVILLVAAFFTAWAMQGYEDLQKTYVWMVWFVPLVLASGGNAGSQSATLMIREIAVSDMNPKDRNFILLRELRLAGVLGVGLMLLAFGVAVAMVELPEAIVVAVTVLMMVILGTTAGALLPLLFKRLGMDPALMSNPLIAALVDVLGVIIYFNTAIALLGPVTQAVE